MDGSGSAGAPPAVAVHGKAKGRAKGKAKGKAKAKASGKRALPFKPPCPANTCPGCWNEQFGRQAGSHTRGRDGTLCTLPRKRRRQAGIEAAAAAALFDIDAVGEVAGEQPDAVGERSADGDVAVEAEAGGAAGLAEDAGDDP